MPWTGNVNILALLIAFQDYSPTDTQTAIHNKLFGSGDSAYYPEDSLTNFYTRSSYGKLSLSGNTLGWYTTSYPRSNIPETTAGREALLKEVLTHWDTQGHDFSQYDNDGDGDIDYFVVIWAGPHGEWSSFWWGYQTRFRDSSYTLDGKTLTKYSWQWEAYTPGNPFHPGSVIHAAGHSLGVPDFYVYVGTVGPDGGVGGLDVMHDSGDHNSFTKWMLEWITPTFITAGSQQVTLRASASMKMRS